MAIFGDFANAMNSGLSADSNEAVAVAEKLQGVKADIVVVDPPRAGCDKKLLETIAQIGPERLVYVSCDPATLARDIKILISLGYNAEEYTVFDMFPRTGHVESVVCLSRK